MDQRDLVAEADRNLRQRGIEVSLRACLDEGRSPLELLESIKVRDPESDLAVIVTIGDFDIDDFVAGLITFVGQLDPAVRLVWFTNFTKAVFLAGQPDRYLKHLDRSAVRSPSQSIAWLGPDTLPRNKRLIQLLQPLKTRACPPLRDVVAVVPGEGPSRAVDLLVDSHRMPSLEAYLVALSHSVAEAFHLGHLPPGTRLRIRHSEIDKLADNRIYTRVHLDPSGGERLALLTCMLPAEA